MHSETSDETKNVERTLLYIDKALVEKDAAAFEQLLSDDFIGAIPTGESFSKKAYIQHHCKPGFGIMALTGEDRGSTSIRFYDDTAVVNRRVHAYFKLPAGNLIDYDVQRIEVLAKDNDTWKMVSGQGTQVKPVFSL